MANEEQIRYWTEVAGPHWLWHEAYYDTMLAPLGDVTLQALAPEAGWHVLDVGCGFGSSTLALARAVGPGGRVMGLDASEPMLDRARRRADEAGLPNVIWREDDGQTAALPAAHFDGIFSRFGVMFFEDPVAAFANLLASSRPGGRLAFACWGPLEANPWMSTPSQVLASFLADAPPATPPGAPGAFAFGDEERVARILAGAGWSNVAQRRHETEVALGGSDGVDGAVEQAMGTAVGRLVAAGDPHCRDLAVAALHDALARHVVDGRVRLGGVYRVVTAERAR